MTPTKPTPEQVWIGYETVDNPTDENLIFETDGHGTKYLRADRHPDRQLIEQLRPAIDEAWSVISSINASRHHKVMIEGAECYWQTDDWVKWAKEEILPIIEKARATGEGV